MTYLKLCVGQTLEQILILALPTLLTAWVMHQVSKRNWHYGSRLVGRGAFMYLTAIGTVIHEISHAIACIIFRHKINEIALFKPNSADGSLGYVNHSYNPKSFYQRMGNLPIGVAPIIGGGIALALLLLLLGEGRSIRPWLQDSHGGGGPLDHLLRSLSMALNAIVHIVKSVRLLSWQGGLLLYLTFCIGSHISLSKPDIRGAVPAIPFWLVAILVLNLLTAWLPGYPRAVGWIMALGGASLGLFILVLAINSVLLLVLWLLVSALKAG